MAASDYFTLKSGRRLYANCSIIGLQPAPNWTLTQGLDGSLGVNLTPEEEHEVADMMIERWRAFKAQIKDP